MNLRDRSALERTAIWLDELIQLCRPRGLLAGAADQRRIADVSRKAKSLRTSLTNLQEALDHQTSLTHLRKAEEHDANRTGP